MLSKLRIMWLWLHYVLTTMDSVLVKELESRLLESFTGYEIK